MKRITLLSLALLVFGLYGCDNDDEGFSSKDRRRTLAELNGTYQGSMSVSYQNNRLDTFNDVKVFSNDSLTISLPLDHIADRLSNVTVASLLRQVKTADLKVAYNFLQRDNSSVHFVLKPDTYLFFYWYGLPGIEMTFSQDYGGDALLNTSSLVFNLLLQDLWYGDERHELNLRYHFEGSKLRS